MGAHNYKFSEKFKSINQEKHSDYRYNPKTDLTFFLKSSTCSDFHAWAEMCNFETLVTVETNLDGRCYQIDFHNK